MPTTRRAFIRDMSSGLAAAGAAATSLACAAGTGTAGDSESLLVPDPEHLTPAPVGLDRLPLEWHQRRTHQLKETAAAAHGTDAVVLGSDVNMVYFTGCYRSSGERSTWVMFPVMEADAAYWYSPGIDRDLITTWWCTENEYYFCYPHAEGGFPNLGQVRRGPRVDLFAWMLEGLGRRGLDGKTVGIDRTLSATERETAARVLPRARFVDISAICSGMQRIKTPEELALIQRAYRYFDRIHAFARDYILERGTDLTDFELGEALRAYGVSLLMQDVRRDGRPHSAVGIDVTANYVRAGVASAYPHPNQFFHNRIERGKTVYVNTDILLGGFGGECYRNYLIGPWTPEQERLWEVVTETIEIQERESRAGAVCADVAAAIHRHQVESGMQDFIYHRPAHGQGQFLSGHQPPFIALGDDTVLAEDMTFSMEPGLYDEANGIGINPSDNLRITATRGIRFSSVPFTKEWSFLTL